MAFLLATQSNCRPPGIPAAYKSLIPGCQRDRGGPGRSLGGNLSQGGESSCTLAPCGFRCGRKFPTTLRGTSLIRATT